MSSELLNIIVAITSIITTIILIITLRIAVRQIKQNTIISYHQYYKDINMALLQNPKLAEALLGESEEDVMASIILGTLELAFKFHREHLIDRRWWKSDEATIDHVLKQEPMRRHWQQNKHLYNQEFVQFIEAKFRQLDSESQNSLKVPQQQSVPTRTSEMNTGK